MEEFVMAIETQELDQARVEGFMGQALGDAAGLYAAVLAMVGDRLGLFRALAEGGPATAGELAERAGVAERYALEWLRGLYAATYLELGDDGRFVLPAAHAQVLAAEDGPFFLGGAYELTYGFLAPIDRLIDAFRSGGGVPQAAYPHEAYHGMARFSSPVYAHVLVQDWIPRVAGLRERLERGARWADVGCGGGRALIRLAEAFPNSTFVGYDQFGRQLDMARASAAAAGVADRVRFEVLEGAQGIPGRFDVISTFDVVHDAVDPDALVTGIRRSLTDDGTYLMLEMNCADEHADNRGPLATVLYGFSVLYCMTTSLAHGGAGLGTCGCPPAVVERIGHHAGFGTVHEVPIGDPFNRLYELRP
jgi:SAM-dependent methyltransferase